MSEESYPTTRIGRTREQSTPYWPVNEGARPDAPNVVIVYMDDMGFSDIGCYGAEIETPNIDALASRGIRFNGYTTHPICSPARAALLTGKNAHAVSSGWIANNDPGFPGYSGEIPDDAVTIAETLRAGGYRTLMTGKWHNTPIFKCVPSAPKDTWPCQRGFEYFYGFMEEETTYFFPARLMLNNAVLPVDKYQEGYYSTTAWTDAAIAYLKELRASGERVPFFLYLANNAPHAPLQAPEATIERYRRRYRSGWDAVRQARYERQLQLGIIPAETRLAPREAGVPAWEETPSEDRELLAAHMAVYAAVVDEADRSLGRLVKCIEELGELENTIIIFSSDNGASSAGGPIGAINNNRRFAGLPYLPAAEERRHLDRLGSERSAPLYPIGWGQVSNTPFPSFKTYTGAGGRRVPLIVSWPRRMHEFGAIRSQFAHVTDLMPTILELVEVPTLSEYRGKPTRPLDGKSLVPALLDPRASTRLTQYYECWSNRAYYDEGWVAVSIQERGAPIDMDRWTLHDLSRDFSECVDVSREHPGKLREMLEAFDRDAWINLVYPLDNRSVVERFREIPAYWEENANRPHRFHRGTQTVHRAVIQPLLDNRSFEVETVFWYDPGDAGVLWSIGENIGGMLMYILEGNLRLYYNGFGECSEMPLVKLSPGQHSAILQYKVRANREGLARILLNGAPATDWTNLSPSLSVGFHEGLDIGLDRRGPVSWEIYERYGVFPYRGEIQHVSVVPGDRAP